MALLRPAVFVARDGILLPLGACEDAARRPELPTRWAGAFARELGRLGFLLFAFACEPGLARGELTPAALVARERRLRETLERSGGRLDELLVCPHGESAGGEPCPCRPPRPGLFIDAAARHRIDLTRSFLLGVNLEQIAAGRRAGLAAILVGAPAGTDDKAAIQGIRPHYTVADLVSAGELVRRARSARVAGDS